jgi:outer membrane lipoprotein carrier protein
MKNFLSTFLFCSFFLMNSSAQVTGLLKELQNRFNSVTDISADFKQFTNGKLSVSGKFLYKKSNKLRLELKNAVIISNGSDNWNYNKKENKVVISSSDENDPGVFSLEKFIFDYPAKCSVEESIENGANIIKLVPKNSSLNFSSAILFPNNNLLEKLVITDTGGQTYLIEFTNIKLNPGLPENKFNFTPSEGTKVIDLR